MYLFILLVVATIMAIFGLIGFLRTTRASVLLLGIMLGGLIFLKVFGERLVKFVNAGWGFVRSAGGTSSPSQLVNPQDPAAFYLLSFLRVRVDGLGAGAAEIAQAIRADSHSPACSSGLINGYIVAAYTVDVLFPALRHSCRCRFRCRA